MRTLAKSKAADDDQNGRSGWEAEAVNLQFEAGILRNTFFPSSLSVSGKNLSCG